MVDSHDQAGSRARVNRHASELHVKVTQFGGTNESPLKYILELFGFYAQFTVDE